MVSPNVAIFFPFLPSSSTPQAQLSAVSFTLTPFCGRLPWQNLPTPSTHSNPIMQGMTFNLNLPQIQACCRALANGMLQLCLTQAAVQVIPLTAAKAGVTHELEETSFPLTSLFLPMQCTEASGRRSSCWPLLPRWWEGCCWCAACPSSALAPTRSEEGSSSPRVSCGNGIELGLEGSGCAQLQACRGRGGSRG